LAAALTNLIALWRGFLYIFHIVKLFGSDPDFTTIPISKLSGLTGHDMNHH